MVGDLASKYVQIDRQIKALERAVLAFQPTMVGAVGSRAAIDTSIAIILSARLSTVWKRIGKTAAAPQGRRGSALRRLTTGPVAMVEGRRGR